MSTVERLWSWGRLAVFIAAAAAWYPLRAWPLLAGTASGIGALVFVAAVVCHREARSERDGARRLLLVIGEAARRLGGAVTLIRSHERPPDPGGGSAPLEPALDNGPTWGLTDQEFDDVDLYAPPVGVFGLLNRTSTVVGARRLRDMVEHVCLSPTRILARQRAVSWLDEHPAERLQMMAAAAGLRGRDDLLDRFVRAVRGSAALPWPIASLVLRLWSVLTAAITIVACLQLGAGRWRWAWAIVALLILNGCAFLRIRPVLQACLSAWRNAGVVAAGLLDVAREAATSLPDETELRVLRDRLGVVAQRSLLPSLCRRVSWADTGGAFHALFNALFFYDLHVAEAILRRAVPGRDALLAGSSAAAELEALASLASFAWEQPVRCYPIPAAEATLSVIGGVHPLIRPERVVANDLRLTPATRMWIVTGANMAGKSTFLRMVGVNYLLAHVGAAAAAREMTFVPSRLVSDLQVRDDLSREESYFLAEVRHLRRIVVPQDDGSTFLGLMDEPFRGTNSTERIAASLALIQHLKGTRHFFVVATHEQQLTDLADGSPAANYHFREELEADGLVFDYRLRPGPAATRNALRVLQREGYPAPVLEAAEAWMRRGRPGGDADSSREL